MSLAICSTETHLDGSELRGGQTLEYSGRHEESRQVTGGDYAPHGGGGNPPGQSGTVSMESRDGIVARKAAGVTARTGLADNQCQQHSRHVDASAYRGHFLGP